MRWVRQLGKARQLGEASCLASAGRVTRVSMKLGVTGNHVLVSLASPFYYCNMIMVTIVIINFFYYYCYYGAVKLSVCYSHKKVLRRKVLRRKDEILNGLQALAELRDTIISFSFLNLSGIAR